MYVGRYVVYTKLYLLLPSILCTSLNVRTYIRTYIPHVLYIRMYVSSLNGDVVEQSQTYVRTSVERGINCSETF